LEITPSAAAKAALDPRLATRARVAKNEVAIFITFTSFLVFTKYLRKADAKPRDRKNPPLNTEQQRNYGRTRDRLGRNSDEGSVPSFGQAPNYRRLPLSDSVMKKRGIGCVTVRTARNSLTGRI
jgi:hypothetical protein